MGFWKTTTDTIGKTAHEARMARIDRQIAGKASPVRDYFGKKTGQLLGSFRGDAFGTAGSLAGKPVKLLKWGALAAVAAGGLAYLASAGRKKVTPESVAHEPLEPQDFGNIAADIPQEPMLPPMAAQSPLQEPLGQQEDTTWRDRVGRNDGPEGPEKLASAPTPDIASGRFEDVSTESNLSLGT